MQAPLTIAIIVATVLVSLGGFRDPALVERLIFSPEDILARRQGYRLITSAFLHADFAHLFFNVYSLYAFGRSLEPVYGTGNLALIYFGAIIGGGLLSLWLHRHHHYRAYGASGGVCGVIYAYIFLFPGAGIQFIFIPIDIPAWLYAIGYLLISIYGLRKQAGNIGHDAHIGGAMVGLLVATALHPYIIRAQPLLYSAVMLISLLLLIYVVRNPLLLPLGSFARPGWLRRPARIRPARPEEENEKVNRLLDKVSASGLNSLTEAEHQFLLKASRKSGKDNKLGG
jgi:membrane associated rhomboid family serine protease